MAKKSLESNIWKKKKLDDMTIHFESNPGCELIKTW